jgi:hypothetical protein
MGSKKRGSLSYIGHTYIQDLSQQTKDHAQQICTHQLFTDQTLNQFRDAQIFIIIGTNLKQKQITNTNNARSNTKGSN